MIFKKFLFFALFLFLTSLKGHSQPTDPGGTGTDPDVPIDGGISLLAAAGIGYGTKKIIDHRKKRTQEE